MPAPGLDLARNHHPKCMYLRVVGAKCDCGSNVCEHGSLRRQCEICERDERIAELERERDEARKEASIMRVAFGLRCEESAEEIYRRCRFPWEKD